MEKLCRMWKLMYPDSTINKQESYADIKARAGKVRTAFLQLKNIWNSRQLSVNIGVTTFNTNITTIPLHGDETCRTTTINIDQVQVFINDCLRKILQILFAEYCQQQTIVREKKPTYS
ncbi:unnamed protein product [Schistosoma margrebowiei]|uniref:DUF6451 domain-containing protein n=1 Tax=Schistosoma margrebowiei TaxID=48269 RepID=A0A183L8B3_9TREM|nr:unnamed protein product [Schistosoma margrebowiei]